MCKHRHRAQIRIIKIEASRSSTACTTPPEGAGSYAAELGIASQLAVLANGEMYQLTPHENSFSRHAKCANSSALGIEIQGQGREDLDANQVQFQSVVKLVRYLQSKYSIQTEFKVEGNEMSDTMRFYGVTTHKIVDTYCSNSSDKQDVHDEYLVRVILQN